MLSRPLFAGEVHGPNLTFNVQTGRVLSHENPFDKWYPASLTKLMTAYVVLREIKRGKITMASPVRISPDALAQPPSKMGFPVGTILTVEAALRIIMVKSANDVAHAIAESVGGTVEDFAGLMNRYGREIGMTGSSWVNPHGLHDPDQFSTAHDMAVLARQIYREFSDHQHLFGMHAIQVGKRRYRNHNALMRQFPGTIGMKTGFICAGGLSVVTSSRRNDRAIVSVVMGGQSGKARNALAAQLQAVGHKRVENDTLPLLDELKPDRAPKAPVDISGLVCGRKGKPATRLMISDRAVELFPVVQMSVAERQDTYLSNEPVSHDAVKVSLGGADGPDPFELLVEKPPLRLTDEFASGSEEEEPEERFKLANGDVVAVPVRRPDGQEAE